MFVWHILGGVLKNAEDDTQTIRTEDFVDKFQDTLVYSSGKHNIY